MGYSKSSFKREVHQNIGLPQETRKISNRLTYHLKELEKKNKGQSQQKEGNIKVKKETNEIETKKYKKQ